MIRQIARPGRFLRCLVQTQPKALASPASIASTTLAARFNSNREPPTADKPLRVNKDSKNQIFDQLVRSNKVVIFMKGTPQAPRCGFSNAVVQILRMHGVQYDAHDVLADDQLREGIKSYTDWPTIPQVFIDGEFVGGCDILLEMHQNGDLVEQLSKAGIESELLRLQKVVDKKSDKKTEN